MTDKAQIAYERIHAAAKELVAIPCFGDMYNAQGSDYSLDAWIIRLPAYTFTSYQVQRVAAILANHDMNLDSFVVNATSGGVSLALIVTVKYL